MELPMLDMIGHWIAIFLTISILSYLYADNPFYKLAEHLFVGISIGYVVVIQYFDVLRPNLIDRLTNEALGPSRFFYLVPVLLVVFLFARLSQRFGWLGRIPIAFVVGIYAGQNVTAIANADLVAQVHATVARVQDFARCLSDPANAACATVDVSWAAGLGLFVLVFGMIAGLVYFFFSIEHKGAVGAVGRVGVWVLMVGFGASFGYTVQGRISLAIGRAMEVMGMTHTAAQQEQLHSKTVALAFIVVIFGTVIWLERRRIAAERARSS